MSDRSWKAERSVRREAHHKETKAMQKVTLELHLHAATDRAIYVSDDGEEDNAVWLPRSQIDVDENAEIGETTSIEVPEWLAKREGLI